MRDGVAHEVNQRIGNVLDDVVVELGLRAFEHKLDGLAGGLRGVADRARKARIEIADGHHARGGDFILQVVRELREFVDIGIDAAHETFELRQNFRDVRGNFRERARKNVHIVVAIHLEFAELEQIVRHDRRFRLEAAAERVHLRGVASWHQSDVQAAEFVLVLKFGDFVREAGFRKRENFDQLRKLGQSSEHPGAVDDEFTDGIHHSVEALERNPDGLGLRQGL